MARVIAALIRHGDYHQLPDTPSAHQPFPLNEAGLGHARLAAQEIAGALDTEGWRLSPVVDSSRLLRAWQTARIVCERLDGRFAREPTLESFDALAERGLGSAANLTIGQIEAILHEDPRFEAPPTDWKSNSHYRLPLQGAESLLEAGARVAEHLRQRMESLAGTVREDTLKLFVGHGAAFRHAAYHLGILAFDDIARLSMYHGRPVLLEYRGEGSWRQAGGEWRVRGPAEEGLD